MSIILYYDDCFLLELECKDTNNFQTDKIYLMTTSVNAQHSDKRQISR